ncbi:hypothetical protein GCM10022403_053020 [Streptomyces coacervatus]|uniref:Secreted protein n=1 Tax=Streptomyces coacervatus TaxID=647381 RepID=A0ABP7I9C4_9ACTN|nr:hypothetical protein [Streptomyces coacervatus]MDF2272780.1 hypothetical protein [Streptomyces coacervatus]
MRHRTRNRTWVASAGATAALVVAAGLYVQALEAGHSDGGLRAAPGRVEPAATDGTCVGTRPVGSLPDVDGGSPLERVVTHIDQLARKKYSDVYTGLSVTEADSATDVWRRPSTAFDAEICRAVVRGVTVRLHDTDVSGKTLDALADRIGDDMNRWDSTFEMREVGVDERGFVLVGVDDPDKARPIIEKAYGERNSRYIKVEYADQAEAADAG